MRTPSNLPKKEHITVNLHKPTFKRLILLASERMRTTEKRETASSVTDFLLDFYENNKQQA
jgi:hypothetical protein